MLVEEHFSLRLTRIKAPEEWSFQREGLVFLVFKDGAGSYVADNALIQPKTGDVLILSEGNRGKLSVSQGVEVTFWNFSLCLEHLFPLFAGNEISLLQDVVSGLKNAKLLAAATPLASQVNQLIEEVTPEFNLDHRGQLLRIAAAVLAEEFKTAHHQRAGFIRTEDRIVQVFEKLSTDELLNLSIAELATKFGCSRRHLSRLSQQYLGRSIAAMKMEMRLMKAAACLRNPQAKIINVAEQCGFNHLGLFNTCFKKRFGASPGRWRNLNAEKSSNLNGELSYLSPSNEPGSARILLRIPNPNGKDSQNVTIAAVQQKIVKHKARQGVYRNANRKAAQEKLASSLVQHKNGKTGHRRNSYQMRPSGEKAF
jgi:AraC-like DNA-binding protein